MATPSRDARATRTRSRGSVSLWSPAVFSQWSHRGLPPPRSSRGRHPAVSSTSRRGRRARRHSHRGGLHSRRALPPIYAGVSRATHVVQFAPALYMLIASSPSGRVFSSLGAAQADRRCRGRAAAATERRREPRRRRRRSRHQRYQRYRRSEAPEVPRGACPEARDESPKRSRPFPEKKLTCLFLSYPQPSRAGDTPVDERADEGKRSVVHSGPQVFHRSSTGLPTILSTSKL